MKTRKYTCSNCKLVFYDACYNWYAYYGEGKFHLCPTCNSKLVPTYDYEYIGFLDKITIRLFVISAMAWVIVGFFWGWQFAGVLAFCVPASVGGVTHVMYWSVLSNIEDKDIQETRIRPNTTA